MNVFLFSCTYSIALLFDCSVRVPPSSRWVCDACVIIQGGYGSIKSNNSTYKKCEQKGSQERTHRVVAACIAAVIFVGVFFSSFSSLFSFGRIVLRACVRVVLL